MIAPVAASANARVYLDNNATTPMVPEVLDAMLAVLQAVGNPSSKHADGDAARARLGAARQDVAQLFGAAPAELEAQVTKTIEDGVSGVEGVRHIASSITDGLSVPLGTVAHHFVLMRG